MVVFLFICAPIDICGFINFSPPCSCSPCAFYFAFSHHVFSEARWYSSVVQDRWNWRALCLCSCHRNIILWSLRYDQEHLWGRLMTKFLLQLFPWLCPNSFARCSETEIIKMMISPKNIHIRLVGFFSLYFCFWWSSHQLYSYLLASIQEE